MAATGGKLCGLCACTNNWATCMAVVARCSIQREMPSMTKVTLSAQGLLDLEPTPWWRTQISCGATWCTFLWQLLLAGPRYLQYFCNNRTAWKASEYTAWITWRAWCGTRTMRCIQAWVWHSCSVVFWEAWLHLSGPQAIRAPASQQHIHVRAQEQQRLAYLKAAATVQGWLWCTSTACTYSYQNVSHRYRWTVHGNRSHGHLDPMWQTMLGKSAQMLLV